MPFIREWLECQGGTQQKTVDTHDGAYLSNSFGASKLKMRFVRAGLVLWVINPVASFGSAEHVNRVHTSKFLGRRGQHARMSVGC